jgi:hypothetical protein
MFMKKSEELGQVLESFTRGGKGLLGKGNHAIWLSNSRARDDGVTVDIETAYFIYYLFHLTTSLVF